MADTFPEITITLADYQPHKRNYNRHPASQIERLRASLRKFGQPRNIVVWRKYFVAGHGVAQAAMAEGWATLRANEIPADWPETRVMAFLAADNELSRLSDPDQAALAALIDEARQFDGELLAAIGYDDREFDALLKEVGKATTTTNGDAPPQVDRADELRKLWQVEPGQLWRIGEHRLICGDCTDAATVARVMGGEKAAVVFTDPPYGVSVGAKNRMLNSFQKAGRNLTDIESDDLKPEELKAMLLPAFINVREMVMADDCTVFMAAPQRGELGMMMMMMMKEAGLPIRHVLIWKKNAPTFSMGRLDYDYQHEPILLTWGKRHKRPLMGKHRTSIWEIDKPRSSASHPTMKPPELYENAYLNNSDKGDIAFEPYAGSGTAFVASQNTGRLARGIEISPAYCSIILQRMADAFPGIEIERMNG